MNIVSDTLKIQTDAVLPFSALTGEGIKRIWQAIFQAALTSGTVSSEQ
jgi:hypothetical protein